MPERCIHGHKQNASAEVITRSQRFDIVGERLTLTQQTRPGLLRGTGQCTTGELVVQVGTYPFDCGAINGVKPRRKWAGLPNVVFT